MKFKYHIVIGCLVLIFSTVSKAQFVTIPDANFVTWLNANGYSGCMNGNQLDTSCQTVINATSVVCSASGISNLSGIEYFDNLLTLYCQTNSLTALPTLPFTLLDLSCTNNQLTTLSSLPPSLRNLSCGGNMLTSLPSLPGTLNSLTVSSNQLTSLPALPNSLDNLLCGGNQLSSLPPLPASLNFLSCGSNQLTVLPSLPAGLTTLICMFNELTTLPALPLTMDYVVCNNNPITSLPALPNSLFNLNCGSTLLTQLPPLPSDLNQLLIGDNPSLLCLPTMPNLETFIWNNTGIKCFPNNFTVSMNAGPSIANIPICTTPSQPGTISGLTSICSGTTTTYSVSPVSNTTGYIWNLPSGWTGASTTNTITVTTGNSGGVISVAAKNDCVNSTSTIRTLNVSVNNNIAPPVSINVSGGNIKVCPGDNRTYTTQLINGVTYNWTVPPGATILSGQGTNSINVSFTPNFISNGAISVAIVSGNCISTARNIRVNRNIPSTPSIISGTITGLCNSTGNIYSVINTPGLSYQWTVPSGATITSGQGTNSILVSFGSTNTTGSIIVKGVSTCGAGSGRSLTVTTRPGNPISINGSTSVCANQQNVNYTTPLIASAASYNWQVPAGSIITAGQGTNSINMNYGSNGGFVRVRTLNNCGAGKYINLPVTIVCREGYESNSTLIYPNPSTTSFVITGPAEEEECKLTIYNLSGEEVIRYDKIKSPFHFGENLNSGIYIVQLTSENINKHIRIVKE